MYDSGGLTVGPYTGERVAPFSANTSAGIGALAATANNPLTADATAALQSNLNMDDTYRDFDLIKESVTDDVQSGLASMFAGGGINSGLAGGYASSEMARALAGVEYDQYNQAKARQMQGIGMAPTISNMGRQDASALITAGNMQDQQNQAMIDADMAQYYEGENADIDALNRYSALIGGYGGLGGTSTTTGGQSNTAANIGGLLSGVGAVLPFFSDRRLKQDIVKIGETEGGTNIYSFKYLWSDEPQVGVMADENPHAVVGQVAGFDVVDYGAIK